MLTRHVTITTSKVGKSKVECPTVSCPDCDCDGFLAVVKIFLPIVNVLPLVAIVYLIGSTVTDLYAAPTRTLAPNPNPNPNPNPSP